MKSYGEGCALARGLDVVGERWTLLLVRELLIGPKRFTDLEAGLPGISSTLLGERLRQLDGLGIVTRRRLRPPAASIVYELTAKGRSLDEAIYALARWGTKHGRDRRPEDAVNPEWAVLAVRSALRPEALRTLKATYELRLDGDEPLVAHVAQGAVSIVDRPGETADVVMSLDARTLMDLAVDRTTIDAALAAGILGVDGDLAVARELVDALHPQS